LNETAMERRLKGGECFEGDSYGKEVSVFNDTAMERR